MTEPRPRELILATLTTDTAGLADAALDWLTADADDPRAWDLVSQLELQTFLWYSLPMKWMTENREHHEVAWGLGDFFRAAGKPRFAEICRAQHTHLLIDLWDADSPRARAEYNRLLDQSGVHPPDTGSLTWGSLMGLTEALAFTIASDALEDAIDAGTRTPGGRGWRRRAVAVAEAALARPYREAPEFSLAGAVRRERREQWVNHVRGRGLDLPQAVADAVTTPAGVTRRLDSPGSAFGWLAPLPPWSYLLHRPLTEVGRVACRAGLRHVARGAASGLGCSLGCSFSSGGRRRTRRDPTVFHPGRRRRFVLRW